MFVYLFILFCALFMGFMFFLIKTAPYGFEDENGIHLFKKLEEMDDYINKVSAQSPVPETKPKPTASGANPGSACFNKVNEYAIR